MKTFLSQLKSYKLPFLQENKKLILQFIFSVFFIAIGIWFIRHEKSELQNVKSIVLSSNGYWVISGILLSFFYLFLHGFMYSESFKSIGCKITVWKGTLLFLKRNFISVFLPAGGVSSLAFFTGDIEKEGVTKTQIHLASSIYGFIGILSVIVVAIPAFIYGLLHNSVGGDEWIALLTVLLLIVALYYIYQSLLNKKLIFNLVKKFIPTVEVYIDDLRANKINKVRFFTALFFSILIEFSGIFHLFIAMKAMGAQPSWFSAILGYIVAVVFLVISPFLRGIGPVEVSLTYVLSRFGYTTVEAIAITVLYRFFEFWIPLFAGLVTFLSKVNKLAFRVLPAMLLFILGIVNIVSGMTPAINDRLDLVKGFLPLNIITASNYFVILTGLLLLVTATFLLKGLKTAWYFALFFSIVSVIGHLTKAIDYEEAIVALIVITVLIFTRKEYYIKTNPKLRNVGVQTALLSILAVLIYGIIGFYFLDKKHFLIDFSLIQSIKYTLLNFFLVGSSNLVPSGPFASHFLLSINISGLLTICFLIYTLASPYLIKTQATAEELGKAEDLVKKYGNSALDFFKTYSDKILFFPVNVEAFLAYRISGTFAVVLENPVAANEESMKECIKRFNKYCKINGLRSIYYRVPGENINLYKSLGKKALFIGQEAVVDLSKFTLEGGTRKPMRNAVNKIKDKGYKAVFYTSPVKDGILQKLKSVSDEWLHDTGRKEIVFSQGVFNWDELKLQTILTVESPEEKIIAFINIIPDYTKGEATYDLIRKTKDAPNGIMDFILVELFKYFKENGFTHVNMGFAPMSGIETPRDFPERSMKFAYEKIKSFSHYKGLREYKDKFFPEWHNKFLVYEHDYDLLQAPSVLNKIIKP